MKQALFVIALLATSLAHAGNDNANPCGNNGNNCNTVVNGGQGGAGGTGIGLGVGIGIGGGASIDSNIKNTVNTNIDASTRSNASALAAQQQKQQQKQQQEQKQTATGGNVGDIAIDASTKYERNTASAYSNLAAPSAPCMGSSSIGAQGAVFGFSAGTTWTAVKCDDREDIRVAYNYGDKEVAEQMLVNKIDGYAQAKKQVEDRKAGR